MKKAVFVISILFLISIQNKVFSQDKILLRSGSIIEAKVSEVSKSEIRYKSTGNITGPEYLLKKNKVEKIIYSNGQEDDFIKAKSDNELKRNAFAYHISDVVYNDFTLSYEHINKSGKLGIKIPLALGYNTDYEGGRDYISLFYSGIGINMYPTGQHRATYFMGPELHIGYGKDTYYYYDDYFSYHSQKSAEFAYARLMVNNGLSYYPIDNFRLAAVLGIGVRYFDSGRDSSNSGMQSTAYFTISMGYMF